jgi:predicted RNase H-like HicB family nuclease
MDVAVRIHWDDEAEVWVAINDELGIALESESYDALVERLKMAIPEMAELNGLAG